MFVRLVPAIIRLLVMPTADAYAAAPCPNCGYDLRGHTTPACCPECGRTVHTGVALSEMMQWVDNRLLDLWSIAVMQIIGAIGCGVGLLALRSGMYVALLLTMFAGVCVTAGTLWLLGVAGGVAFRFRKPTMRVVPAPRRRQLIQWLTGDLSLTLLIVLLLSLLG